MSQPHRQAARWWLRRTPRPLPDMGLTTWWSVLLAVVLGAGFAVSALVEGYTYVDSFISPSPPTPSEQIGQYESELERGQQQLEIITNEVADATARL